MEIIDGRGIAREILAELKIQAAALPFAPVFCDVLVGDDPASAQYVRMKAAAAERIGFKFRGANFPAAISADELMAEIKKISREPNVRGLIVQLPLPQGLPRQQILDAIDPAVDVDCMGSKNLADFYQGNARFIPPTAAAVMKILNTLNLDLSAKEILVVGQGELVGKPVTYLLRQKGFSVNTADANTNNTGELIKSADVLISAAGKAGLITGSQIKPGAVIIDAGTSESEGGIVGDVDFESTKNIAGFISPVPGGVGPVTVAQLLENVILAARASEKV